MSDIMRPNKKIKISVSINDEEAYMSEWFQDAGSGVVTQSISGVCPSTSSKGIVLSAINRVAASDFTDVNPTYHYGTIERAELREIKSKQISTQPKKLQLVEDFPRRHRIDLFTPAEKAIYDAMQAVEMAGANPLLTDAVNLLSKARDLVADYVELEKK